jgi:hypothetical protein
LKEKRVKHDARVGEAIRIKKRKGNRKRGWFKMFSALFIDLRRTTVRDDAKKRKKKGLAEKERKNLNERPSCKVKLQNQ